MIKIEEIRTLGDLLNTLQKASPDQLEQPIQTVCHDAIHDHVYELLPVICLATVNELDFQYARSSVDNRRNGNELVLFADYNPHAEDGAIAYECDYAEDDPFKKPIFPHDYDDSQNWTGPAQKLADSDAEEREPGRGTMGVTLIKALEASVDVAKKEKMIVKLRDKRIGDRVETRVFMGVDEDHVRLSGTLVMNIGEWQLFGAALLAGAKITNGQLQVEILYSE